MKSPTLSIIIPVYNASSSVSKIVSSILSQEFQDFELILVDDGSSDDTINILRGLARADARVIVRSKKNGGPSSARNSGLDKARGEYIMFCDADDSVDSKIFTTMVHEIISDEVDIVSCGWLVDLRHNSELVKGYKSISPEQVIVGGSELERKKYITQSIGTNGQLYNLWNKIFRRSIIEQYGLRFDESIHFGEDLIFSLQYFAHIEQLKLIPDTLYHYQTNSSTSLFSKSALVPEYRHKNDEALAKFVGKTDDTQLQDLYQWVRWRWLISYYLIIEKSNLSYSDKKQLVNQAPSHKLKTANRIANIGFKKYVVELIMNIVRRWTVSALFFAYIINLVKNTIISVRSLV